MATADVSEVFEKIREDDFVVVRLDDIRAMEVEGGRFALYDFKGDMHFAIDCACGEYRGSHFSRASEEGRERAKGYEPLDERAKTIHTFYMNHTLFQSMLEPQTDERGNEPLLVVCNNCYNEFPFTNESYKQLFEQIGGLRPIDVADSIVEASQRGKRPVNFRLADSDTYWNGWTHHGNGAILDEAIKHLGFLPTFQTNRQSDGRYYVLEPVGRN